VTVDCRSGNSNIVATILFNKTQQTGEIEAETLFHKDNSTVELMPELSISIRAQPMHK
jgi:hypothetical protein